MIKAGDRVRVIDNSWHLGLYGCNLMQGSNETSPYRLDDLIVVVTKCCLPSSDKNITNDTIVKSTGTGMIYFVMEEFTVSKEQEHCNKCGRPLSDQVIKYL